MWRTIICHLWCSLLLMSYAAGKGLVLQLQKRPSATLYRGRTLLRSGAFELHGTIRDLEYFYATVKLGTPPRKFELIVDTGSTMTYVPCISCEDKCGKHKDPPFDPTTSFTYKHVGCESPKCRCGNPVCECRANDTCFYERDYAEQSSSAGALIEDVLQLGDGVDPVPLVFGCELAETGAIYRQQADGILGLGNSDASIINQLTGLNIIDEMFSLCFGSVEGDGVLLLGDVKVPGSITADYTDLLPTTSHYYIVRLHNIGLGERPLNVKPAIFDIGYGTVLDSGTTFAHLPTEAYVAFREAVDQYALKNHLKRVPGPDPQFVETDTCWAGAPQLTEPSRLHKHFPTMQLYLGGNVTLRVSPMNYLFMHRKVTGGYCLGVFDNGHQGTLLGGIVFRNVLVHYDRVARRVGFGHAPCQRLGQLFSEECLENPSARRCTHGNGALERGGTETGEKEQQDQAAEGLRIEAQNAPKSTANEKGTSTQKSSEAAVAVEEELNPEDDVLPVNYAV